MKKLFMLIAVVLLSAFTVSSQEKVYKIGDLYDVDGVKGIVFSIEEGGRHGKIVALENSADYVYWGNPIYMISTRENYRGSYPTRWYRESIWYDATTNWYIPAIYELQDLYNACAQDGLNEAIQNAGGKPLKKRFWSSTEAFFDKNDFNITYSRSAYAYDMSDGYDFGWDKNGMRLQIRLIRRF